MLEIEVWNSGKTAKLGKRHITEVMAIRPSERPNAASTYSFTIPAEVEGAETIVNGVECYIYAWQRGSRLPLGGGEVLKIRRQEVGDGGTNLVVTGVGLLNELNYEYITSLEIKTVTTGISPLYAYDLGDDASEPNMIDGNTGTSGSTLLGLRGPASAALYLGHTQPFWNPVFDIGTPNAVLADFDPQYWNVSGAVDLTATDGTASGGATMAQDGTITFTAPGDWIQIVTGFASAQQGYWIRLFATANVTANIQNITVTSYDKDTNDLTTLHTAYGGGLALQSGTGYYGSTTNGYYGSFQNMTALQAFRQLAETDNGIFRIAAHDTRTIQYLRDQGFDTGITAVGPTAPSLFANLPSDTVLITGINEEISTEDEVNRLYSYGSGNGFDGRIDLGLADATAFASAHSGFTLDNSDSYIEKTTVTKRKEAGRQFPDIRNIDGAENNYAASEQLAETAFNHLDELVDAVEHIRLELVQLPQALRVGDNIRVLYRSMIYDIDDTYMITQVSYGVTNGVLVANVTASNVSRPPKAENELLYDMIEQQKRASGQPQRIKAKHVSGVAPIRG